MYELFITQGDPMLPAAAISPTIPHQPLTLAVSDDPRPEPLDLPAPPPIPFPAPAAPVPGFDDQLRTARLTALRTLHRIADSIDQPLNDTSIHDLREARLASVAILRLKFEDPENDAVEPAPRKATKPRRAKTATPPADAPSAPAGPESPSDAEPSATDSAPSRSNDPAIVPELPSTPSAGCSTLVSLTPPPESLAQPPNLHAPGSADSCAAPPCSAPPSSAASPSPPASP